MATDWFRQEIWHEEIEKDFFAQLARSRSQRDQYLVIQALTIATRYPMVSIRLIDLYFETKKSSSDDVRALSARADAHLRLAK